MDKRKNSFVKNSFIGIVVLCLLVLTAATAFLSRKTQKTVTELSEFYISTLNSQLRQKFTLAIELTREKLDSVINRTPPQGAVYGELLLDNLRTSADVRSFTYLGFLMEDGSLETIYGKDMKITASENVLDALERKGALAETGEDSQGVRCLLLGRAAEYPAAGGGRSKALVAGISLDYLSSVVFAEADGSNMVMLCHIIDENGGYIIRNHLPNTVSHNYFDYVLKEMSGVDPADAAVYVEGLKASIRDRTEFSTTLPVAGEFQRIQCTPLHENSTWYLVTVMPHGPLDEAVSTLDRERSGIMSASFLTIVIALLLVFYQYYQHSQRQMRALEDAREDAFQANKSKSAFLSSMSHDIRTPMNAIIGMTEIGMKNLDDRDRVEDCLKKISQSGKQLLGLINDILDLSKIESGKMTLHIEEVSLREVMDGVVSIIQPQVKARGQYFDIFIQNVLSECVWCDSVRLNQILMNLLSNALKFTPEGGEISVYLYQEPLPQREGFVRTHFQVDDTGIGMTPDFQRRIFNSFEREATNRVHHTTGSGLGMSITKQIVDMMGGSIEVKSKLGRGTSFLITLDLQKAIADSEMRLPDWNILVIDDNELLCESAASNLTELGVRAEWALSCDEAVKLVEERHARNEDYQFVLVDWEMPQRNGLETIQEIRRRVGDAFPVFLISAYNWTDIQKKLGAEEIAGFIPKPLFKSTLYRALSQHWNGGGEAGDEDAAAVDFSGRRVLLAEDNDLNWEVASELLGEAGLTLERAENGQICVDKFVRSAPGEYALILMDVHMPVMDGYEATRAIRETGRPDSNLPIIAMTADAFAEDVRQCLESGMNYHLSKPLDFAECIEVLRRYINN